MAVRRQVAELRSGPAFLVHQQGTHRGRLGVGIQHAGQVRRGGRLHLGVVVQEEDVRRVGRAPTQIEGLGEAEVLGQQDPLALAKLVGKLLGEFGGAVLGPVVHHDQLEPVAPFGFSTDSRHRRSWAARLCETTTTETRGGCFSDSGWLAGVKPLG